MAESNPQVMDYVVRELEKNPNASPKALFDGAKEIDPSVGELNPRQFHARYPLQAKRRMAAGSGRKRGAAKMGARKRGEGARKSAAKKQTAATSGAAGGGTRGRGSTPRRTRRDSSGPSAGNDREKLRALFLEFADDFAKAESRSEIVRVISSVEGYVSRAEKLIAR